VNRVGANEPAFQVFSVGEQPYLRAGLHVKRLEPGVLHRIDVSRQESTAEVRIVRAGRAEPILRISVALTSTRDELELRVPRGSSTIVLRPVGS
jgi:hypothetical protein